METEPIEESITSSKGKTTKKFGKENIGLIAKDLFKKLLLVSAYELNYNSIIEDCSKRNCLFTDLSFPGNCMSIVKGMMSEDNKISKNKQEIESPIVVNHYSNLKSPTHKIRSSDKMIRGSMIDLEGNDLVPMSFDHHLLNISSGGIIKMISTGSYNGTINSSILYKNWQKVQWMRPLEIISKPQLFPKFNNNPDLLVGYQFKQGMLRSNKLLSAIASVAEDPSRITKLFKSTKVNQHGVYDITLCKHGQWENIIIDDYLPCDFKKKNLCFSYYSDNDTKQNVYLWLSLIEKAFAKSFGSYYLLENITLKESLRYLTGASVTTIDNSNEDLWNEIKNSFNNNYLILASSGHTSASKELLKEVGLLPQFSYNILEAHEVELDEGGSSEYLLKIRNQWGQIDWTGDWSPFSNHWKEDLKEMLNYNNDKETTFWMNFKDFKHYFSKYYICKLDDKSKLHSIKVCQEKGQYNLVKLSISRNRQDLSDDDSFNLSNHYTQISLIQNNQLPSIARIILCKIDSTDNNEDLFYMEGTMGKEKYLTKEYSLLPGEYLIYSELDTLENCHYSLSCYSKYDSEFKFLKASSYPNILERIYSNAAIINDNKYYYTIEDAPSSYKSTNATPEGYAYIYFKNNEENTTLIEDLKYTKLDGLKLLPPYQGSSYSVRVESLKDKIVLLKKTSLSDFNIKYSFR